MNFGFKTKGKPGGNGTDLPRIGKRFPGAGAFRFPVLPRVGKTGVFLPSLGKSVRREKNAGGGTEKKLDKRAEGE